ncbi:MAG: dolichyl-phosphate-mannose--protein mannosyltransferase [Leptospira sp.]|nr:dolichyl-phosphate-mannose--protein mannosyltransferase [Leptospira sp.]
MKQSSLNKYLLLLPFLFYGLLTLFPPLPWFIIQEPLFIQVLCFIFILLASVFYTQHNHTWYARLETVINRNHTFVLFFFFVLYLLLPFQNLNWGDGILLIETNDLETKLFGAQISMDELFEAQLHSYTQVFFRFLGWDQDNRFSYRVLSTFAGFFFLMSVGFFLKTKQSKVTNTLSLSVFLTSLGTLIFYGYIEHYTIVSLFIFITILSIRNWLILEKDSTYILVGATLLVVLGIYLHLVAGYFIIMLTYLWWTLSPREDKFKHLILCAGIGGVLLCVGFYYYLFVHDPAIDRQSSHVLHPPFYPIKRLISLNHVKEIFSLMVWNSLLPVILLSYYFIFHKKDFQLLFSKRENRFLFAATLSFLCHGFFHNPQLGFPADWDLMGFYWIPFAFLGYVILDSDQKIRTLFFPIILFNLFLLGFNAKKLSETNPSDENLVSLTHKLVDNYVLENQAYITTLRKEDKKFFAKGDFFFFKAERITSNLCPFEGQQPLRLELKELRKEWQAASRNGQLQDKTWNFQFLKKATITNTEYIKSLKVYKICHLEL